MNARNKMHPISTIPSIFPLVPKVMHYDWGNRGSASAVARLALAHSPTDIDPAKPYAELWMGTHPNAPSTALLPPDSAPAKPDLLTLIRDHPTQLLGEALCRRSDTNSAQREHGHEHEHEPHDLPFLFKVLSVAKPLSIQAHPDKLLARRLHAHSPHHYKDANHKPEMAIALTEFHALFGFRPSSEIDHHLREYPELAAVAGESAVAAFIAHVESAKSTTADHGLDNNKQALRALFTAIMTASPAVVATQLATLIARLSSQAASSSPIDALLLSTHAHFPNDVGLLCILLMNHITLSPGQAMYMGANELHAYLSGDCIEVMATSDNVVRAGLTPKFKDVDTLTSMLTYTQGGAHAGMLAPVAHAGNQGKTVVYDPPIDEFTVHRTETAAGEEVEVPVVHGPSVVLVTEGIGALSASADGSRIEVKAGSVVYVVPGTKLVLRATEKVVVYQALCEASVAEKQQAGSKL
ncbi:RmlC-like cupin domain-containing protein [Catenaria anguillulae PL171]|uniref:Mannose-6-phosphate isomerase n=1 Tax=Catenaria anguillulae PL171 TaxID=765915 RepID=A0A1Y2HC92_9FUNG|nr:RmlC-like cupin domain-containing protein [Catenaria anguillulae PL171]